MIIEKITSVFHKGSEMVKIENSFMIDSEYFQEDFLFVSRGFIAALERELTPTTENTEEWHHIFVKDAEYGYKAQKVNFA